MTTVNDPFAWRTGGGRIEIGSKEDGGIMDMIVIDDRLFGVTKKSIHSILLADSVDPKRTNPAIPNSQQKVFPYGTDEPFVGRTLLQAKELFEEHALPSSVNNEKALNIAFSFLKEVAVLHEAAEKYNTELKEKNLAFEGKVGADESLRTPSIDSLEQQVKQVVNGVDHAVLLIIDMVRLFYPNIKNKKWVEQMIGELKKQQGSEDAVTFFEEISQWLWLVRNLRNSIEHEEPNNRMEIKNYKLQESGTVQGPTIAFINNDTPFSEIPVLTFITNIVENLLSCLEISMAYLCDLHALPFAGDVRSVIEIPVAKRAPATTHVRFGYHIAWTK